MASSADTKEALGSKENPIVEDEAPPTAAEEGDANEVVPAVESGPTERIAGAVIGGVVEMSKFHMQNLINLMNALLNVERKIAIGLKNYTPVNYTPATELRCRYAYMPYYCQAYMKTVEYAHCVGIGFLD